MYLMFLFWNSYRANVVNDPKIGTTAIENLIKLSFVNIHYFYRIEQAR